MKESTFREFRRICERIGNESSYLEKSKVLSDFFGSGFEGDVYLWAKLLLPMNEKRIYNLQSKQLVKLFSRIFHTNAAEMLKHLENGDVSETIRLYFEKSQSKLKPCKRSELYLHEVDAFLEELSKLSREEEQVEKFEWICQKCTANDLKVIVRLIKHDLKINAGPKHILDGISKDAYTMLQNSRDLKAVIEAVYGSKSSASKKSPQKGDLDLKLMCPIMPMLAEACKSLDTAMRKCPNGMYSEIKYDGERVQLHKQGSSYNFYSRSLKPVMEHKVKPFRNIVAKAFPNVQDLILDAEVIMVDTVTGDLLPFGSLGIHKKEGFANAQVCLFIFDCLYIDGENLTKKTLVERRKRLQEVLKPIKNRIQLSEFKLLTTKEELSQMVAYVLKQGLEGLVMKKVDGIYEPNKRHWLKIKKDYLFDGSMADSADLVALGAWFGTGKKGGLLSIFLMGCYDEDNRVWKTVTKAHSGLDDKTIDELQYLKEKMERPDVRRLPKWFSCNKAMCPDFVAKEPKDMPVFEIVGAEFLKGDGVHTADGISIRFPRVKRIRDDKSAKEATTLNELKYLFKTYKENVDLDLEKLGKGSVAPDPTLLTKYFSPTKDVNTSKRCTHKEEPVDDAPKKKIKLMFDAVTVFVPEDVRKLLPEGTVESFISAGGAVSDDPKQCSHVLHEHSQITGDLSELR